MLKRFVSIAALALLVSPLAVRANNTQAVCTASCGAESPVTCSASSCSAFDRNCSVGEPGRVTCGASTIYCAATCPAETEDCSADSICSYDCPNDPDCYSYNPCDPGPNPLTGCYYNWSPQALCCLAVDPGAGCFNICF